MLKRLVKREQNAWLLSNSSAIWWERPESGRSHQMAELLLSNRATRQALPDKVAGDALLPGLSLGLPCRAGHPPATNKVLSNVPQDIKCSAPRRRKIHDNSMYYFACRCKNEIIHSMYFFEIASKTMHREELAAAKPPPTLLYASTLRFRKHTRY